MTDLRAKLFESLNNAVDNGYELREWSAEDIADDVSEYDPQFEDVDTATMIPIIEEWLQS